VHLYTRRSRAIRDRRLRKRLRARVPEAELVGYRTQGVNKIGLSELAVEPSRFRTPRVDVLRADRLSPAKWFMSTRARVPSRDAFAMLKSVGELLEPVCGHAESASRRMPSQHGVLHLPKDLPRARQSGNTIGRTSAPRLLPAVRLLPNPGLQLANSVRERLHIERWREAPLPTIDMQEAMIPQMVVDIGDEDREGDAPPQLLGISLPTSPCIRSASTISGRRARRPRQHRRRAWWRRRRTLAGRLPGDGRSAGSVPPRRHRFRSGGPRRR
jgi:hypothetical protein